MFNLLKELYDYAVRENLTAIPGFKKRTIDAYISLDKDGNFIGIVPSESKKVFAPDLGNVSRGAQKCDILISQAKYVLGLGDGNIHTKHEFFKSALKEASEFEPAFSVVSDWLDDNERLENLRTELKNSKFKADSAIGFMIDGKPLEKFTGYCDWWEKFRNEQCGKSNSNSKKQSDKSIKNRVCMITGNECNPIDTVSKVNGLILVGGHTSGDAIICFNKEAPAYSSYGFKQGENASVSEEAITAVNAALENLIDDAPVHAKTKFVHWYKEPMTSDYMKILEDDWNCDMFDDTDEEDEEDTNNIIVDKSEVKKLVKSIRKGEKPTMPENIYYIMPLSGGGGRIMVRGFDEGRCEDLHNSIRAWFEDMDLVKIGGGLLSTPKLFRIYTRLLKFSDKDNDIQSRIKDELSGLDNAIMNAIIKDYPIPDSAAVRTLAQIRSRMYSDTKSDFIKYPDSVCCQILKVWLIRRGKKMETCVNENYQSDAYQLGRLFAVYAAIQKKASPEVNVGVVERYYSSASVKPAFVLGKLASLSQYHLANVAKVDKGAAIHYSKMLADISCKVKLPMPSVLTTEEQAEFALGYYQQCAEIFKPKKNKDNTENN